MNGTCEVRCGRSNCHPVVKIVFTLLFYALAIGTIGLAHTVGLSYGWSLVTGVLAARILFNPLMRRMLRLIRGSVATGPGARA